MLYFFPALVPIASLLPGILAVASALFAGFQALRRSWKKVLLAATISLLALGAGIFLHVRNSARQIGLPQLSALESLPTQDTSGSWNQLLPRAPLSDLAFSSEHQLLLFGTRHGTVDAVSTRDGTLRFSLKMAEPVLARPLIVGNQAFLGEGLHDARSARLTAIQLPEGRPLWQRTFSGHIESSPAISGDGETLFGCAGEDGIFALNARDGSMRWHGKLGHCDTTPLLESATLYSLIGTGTESTHLLALDVKTGTTQWKVELPGQPWGTVTRDPQTGFLVMTTGTGQLEPRIAKHESGWAHAIDTREKRNVWSRSLGGMPLLTGEILPASSIAIFTLKKGELVAIDTASGAIRWRRTLPSPVLSSPRKLNDGPVLAVLAYDGTLLQIDGISGQILTSWRISEESTSAPEIFENQAFFATRGELLGFRVHGERINR
ncbi:MAG: hypothetical protein A2X94_11725 [Bdellovibrionales bacterium GWB1_55_8]|nr:MAG: hypothetical protein A2X94_11725 [Bdellovibrionales bacterium GWB1_55_8]